MPPNPFTALGEYLTSAEAEGMAVQLAAGQHVSQVLGSVSAARAWTATSMMPGGRPATGSPAANGPRIPARYCGSDMVTSRASTADFPDPGPPVMTRTLSAGSGAVISQATTCDSAAARRGGAEQPRNRQ
jgi:hypothetical protein